ncbi:hypothetical protein H4582DRAFT_130435 [Lactarius indigo]|nr:hypothetical protein H4582DRAFT_130435 [Lactarius indigo]
MSAEQIHHMGVSEYLGYSGVVLLVCKEYEDAYDQLRSYESDPEGRGGGVVVLGQPGIGKTCFLYYLLFRLLSEKKAVAFQVGEDFLLFQGAGVQRCKSISINGAIIPSGTWALTDSHVSFERPCNAFLKACSAGRAWVVQTTSPSESKYARWQEEWDAKLFWMQVFHFDELYTLGKTLGLNTQTLRDNYNSWGPSARVCVSLTKDPNKVRSHAQSVVRAAYGLTSDGRQFDGFRFVSTHQLFVVRPTDSRQVTAVEFGTNRLRGIVARAYANHDRATRLRFYSAIRGDPMFSSPAGEIYKSHVLLWFRHARNTEFIPCTSNVPHSPLLNIPACPGNLKFFSKPDELQEMYKPGLPICWVPTSETLPTLGAVVLTDDAVITVQITIASKRDTKNIGFIDIYRNLPPRLKTKPRCHVFITDSDSNAESLRDQNLTVPKGTHVYSAIASVEDLDSKVVMTEDCMDALEKER